MNYKQLSYLWLAYAGAAIVAAAVCACVGEWPAFCASISAACPAVCLAAADDMLHKLMGR